MRYSTITLLTGTLLAALALSEAEDLCETTQYLELGSRGMVDCGWEEDFIAVYWYNYTTSSELPIISVSEGVKSGPGYYSGEFDISPSGSLIINQVNMQHNHAFTVIKVENETGEFISVIISVVVVDPYPVVDGCNPDRYCVLQVGRKGVLECSLRGVRPGLQLAWITINEDTSDVITFGDQTQMVRAENGVFDVTLTSNFIINQEDIPRITVLCYVPGYMLSTAVDLLYVTDPSPEPVHQEKHPANNLVPIVVGIALTVIAVVVIIFLIVYCNAPQDSKMKHLENL